MQPPWRGGDRGDAPGGKGRGGDEASSSGAGASGLDAEAGPSTSLLHGREVTSEEEFARMSAAGRAAVRRLRQRRHAGEPSGSSAGAGGSGGKGGWAQGAGPSTAAAGGGEGGADGRKERVPVTLGCGHTFCEPCESRRVLAVLQ